MLEWHKTSGKTTVAGESFNFLMRVQIGTVAHDGHASGWIAL